VNPAAETVRILNLVEYCSWSSTFLSGPMGEDICTSTLQALCGKPWGGQHANRMACTECVVAHETNSV
jgi:hypothetical protein